MSDFEIKLASRELRCGSCRHWGTLTWDPHGHDSDAGLGECKAINNNSEMARVTTPELETSLLTKAEFGCVLHEVKP